MTFFLKRMGYKAVVLEPSCMHLLLYDQSTIAVTFELIHFLMIIIHSISCYSFDLQFGFTNKNSPAADIFRDT
jgi:hypothetical protein